MHPALLVYLSETGHGFNVLLAFHVFQKCSFCTSTLCCFQECLYPKVKTEGYTFHSKDCLCRGRDQSVNQQYTDTAITAMRIRVRDCISLKIGKGKPAEELNLFLYLLLQCEGGQHSEQILHTILWEHKAPL